MIFNHTPKTARFHSQDGSGGGFKNQQLLRNADITITKADKLEIVSKLKSYNRHFSDEGNAVLEKGERVMEVYGGREKNPRYSRDMASALENLKEATEGFKAKLDAICQNHTKDDNQSIIAASQTREQTGNHAHQLDHDKAVVSGMCLSFGKSLGALRVYLNNPEYNKDQGSQSEYIQLVINAISHFRGVFSFMGDAKPSEITITPGSLGGMHHRVNLETGIENPNGRSEF